ncbi:SOS response-associated peptidase [Gracilimonas halophila]|uniref:Abasic site processing protein n=1 Tax=Gracilimonas halophila TaxID=1834464 RepID=A0ABW5JDW3_9BACT
MKRYVLETDRYTIKEVFGVSSDSEIMYEPNYNVMPGHSMPVIIGNDNRKIVRSIWGLDPDNSETSVYELEHEAFTKENSEFSLKDFSPCLIPALGFYKWKETVDDPLPFYLRVITQDVLGVAGLWDTQSESFAVLTMQANALVEPLDNRMPVILDPKEFEEWLSEGVSDMIKNGFSGNQLLPNMSVFRVPELVNDPSNNSKELIQPIPKLRNYDGEDED